MSMFSRADPPPSTHDPRDDFIQELREDKARLSEENASLRQQIQELQDRLILLCDAKSHALLQRAKSPNPIQVPDPARAMQGSSSVIPGDRIRLTPADHRAHIYTPPVSFEEIEAMFEKPQ